MPDDRMLVSYFEFVAWGPFGPKNYRLERLMVSDDKNLPKSTTETRKASELNDKDVKRAHDSSSVRGFPTD